MKKPIPQHQQKLLERNIEKLASKTAKMSVFTIQKDADNTFSIHHYFSGAVVIYGIPTGESAKRVVEQLNATKCQNRRNVLVNKTNKVLKEYYKHYNDIQQYTYTLTNTKDIMLKEALYARLQLSKAKLGIVKHDLRRL